MGPEIIKEHYWRIITDNNRTNNNKRRSRSNLRTENTRTEENVNHNIKIFYRKPTIENIFDGENMKTTNWSARIDLHVDSKKIRNQEIPKLE